MLLLLIRPSPTGGRPPETDSSTIYRLKNDLPAEHSVGSESRSDGGPEVTEGRK